MCFWLCACCWLFNGVCDHAPPSSRAPRRSSLCLKSPKTSRQVILVLCHRGSSKGTRRKISEVKPPVTRRLNTMLQLKTHRTILTLIYKFNQQFAAPCSNVLMRFCRLCRASMHKQHIFLGVKILAADRKYPLVTHPKRLEAGKPSKKLLTLAQLASMHSTRFKLRTHLVFVFYKIFYLRPN